MFKNIIIKMEKTIKPLGCEVRGIDLISEYKPEGNIVFNLNLLII